MSKLIASFLFLVVLFIFSTSKIKGQVVINEFQLKPSSDQWIELYNKGADSVDISGWIVDDKEGANSESFVIPNGVVLLPKTCVSFESGKFNWNTTTADEVRLLNPGIIEQYPYSTFPGNNVSIGRNPDGEGELVTLELQSRDELNSTGESCLVPTPAPTPTPSPSTTPEPTATPVPTITPAPTKTPIPSPTKTPSPKPTATQNSNTISSIAANLEINGTPEGIVLGINETATNTPLPTLTPSPLVSDERKQPFLGYFLIGLGILFLIGSIVILLKQSKSRYNETLSDETDNKEEPL